MTDLLNKREQECQGVMAAAMAAADKGDNKAAAEHLAKYMDMTIAQLKAEKEAQQRAADRGVLAARGVRQLTSEEQEYFAQLHKSLGERNPQAAISNLDKVMPLTVLDTVMADLVNTHPLLDMVQFEKAAGLVEFVVNKTGKQVAKWGKLCAEIDKELEASFEVITLTQNKLSAFIPVCAAMLELGPEWLAEYVQRVLRDALANGLEEGILKGKGVDEPVGMNRDLSKPFDASRGYTTEKTAEKVTKLDAVTYGKLAGKLAEDENKRPRYIGGLFLVCNPQDYYTKIIPATTLATPTGYANNVFPIPTTVIQSEQMDAGKAILGVKGRYFMGVGMDKGGRIEYSDDVKFLEDKRVYKAKFYGTGKPLDNNSHILLDISKLEPLTYTVTAVTPAAAPGVGG